jgi:hypothetical protein
MTADAPSIPGLSADLFRRAMEIYLTQAYPAGIPARAAALLSRALPDGRLELVEPVFEVISDASCGLSRVRFDLRVGRHGFQHMKVSVETGPDGGPLFSVNTHDRVLIRPETDPDAAAIQELIRRNSAFKERVERLWETEGIPTFKAYLRRVILSRRG